MVQPASLGIWSPGMHRLVNLLLPVTIAVVLTTAPALALDANLVGAWQTTIFKLGQPMTMIWEINPDGTYHSMLRAMVGMVEERGQMNAEAGRWSSMST